MSDTITILRTTPTPAGAPRFATKQWAWNATLNAWRKVSYDAGASFAPEERPVSSLADVAAVLDEIRRDPRAFIVRGALRDDVREAWTQNPRLRIRRLKHKGKKGEAPTLEEVPRQWLMIDVDGWPLPASADLATDPEEAIEAVIHALLPECFHDVECFWQLSSSAGFAAGVLKAHLFFWLAEPISNEELKLYFHAHAPAVDRSPFSAAQVHYIADPIIQGGHDPLPRRTGWVKGLDAEVTLPKLDLAALRVMVQERRERVATGAGLDASAARTIAGALALLGDDEGREGWHAPLRRATLLYAIQTPPKLRDDEALKQLCRDAIRDAAEREAHRHHAASDLARFCSDAYLDHQIDGAYRWVEQNKADAPVASAPFHEAPAHKLDEARDTLQSQIRTFLEDVTAWHEVAEEERPQPRQLGLAVDVGGGKSRAGRELIAERVALHKAAGLPHRALWLGPTTKLNAEALEAFSEEAKKHDISVAMHRGREQPDPERPGEAMCLDLEAVKLAQAAGEPVERVVCGSLKE
uniref:hypothetical protein n=1 Tax=Roseomonas chloroacetimidivorans TaxID=1766656 RepID=UPI003C70C895